MNVLIVQLNLRIRTVLQSECLEQNQNSTRVFFSTFNLVKVETWNFTDSKNEQSRYFNLLCR